MEKAYRTDEFVEGQTFTGRLNEIEWEPKVRCSNKECPAIPWSAGDGDKCPECGEKGVEFEQLHIQVHPTDHEISGSTGNYHEWYSYSNRKASKYYKLIEALEEIGVEPKDDELSNLKGVELEWERKDLELGNFEVKDVLIPIGAMDGGKGKGKVKGTKTDHTKEFDELKGLLAKDGLTAKQIERWSKRNGIPKRDVNEFLTELSPQRDEDGTYFMEP